MSWSLQYVPEFSDYWKPNANLLTENDPEVVPALICAKFYIYKLNCNYSWFWTFFCLRVILTGGYKLCDHIDRLQFEG